MRILFTTTLIVLLASVNAQTAPKPFKDVSKNQDVSIEKTSKIDGALPEKIEPKIKGVLKNDSIVIDSLKAIIKNQKIDYDSIRTIIKETLAEEVKTKIAAKIIVDSMVSVHHTQRISKSLFRNYLYNKYNQEKNYLKTHEKDTNNLNNKLQILEEEWTNRKFKKNNFNYTLDQSDIRFFNENIGSNNFKLTEELLEKDTLAQSIKLKVKRNFFLIKRVELIQMERYPIKDISLAVNQDRITKSKVIVEGFKPFFTASSSIPFFSLQRSDRLDRMFNKNNEFVYLGDVIKDYAPKNNNYQIYLDSTYNNIGAGDTLNLYVTNDLNHFIDFSIYSDLPSLLGNQSNGLIEMKFSGSLIINRKNNRNTHTYLTRDLSVDFKLSKIDGELDVIESTEEQIITGLDTAVKIRIMDVYQRAFIGGGAKLSLWKGYFNQENFYSFSFGAAYRSAQFKTYDGAVKNIGVYSGIGDFTLFLKPFEAFGGALNVGYRYTDFKEKKGVVDQDYASIVTTGINLFWEPNKGKKLFFSIEHNTDINSRDEFALFQIGYKAIINKDLFKSR